MDIKLLKSSILSNTIPKFLVFVNREPVLCRQYIDKIASTTNLPYKYYDDAKSVIYDTTTNLKEDYLYCIYNDTKALTVDEYYNYLTTCDRNIIVVLDNIDKVQIKDRSIVVEFNKVDRNTMCAYYTKYLKDRNIQVSQDKLFEIIDCCDQDLGIVQNEIDKVVTLGQSSSDILVEYLLKNGFPDYRKVNTETFVKKILKNDTSAFRDLLKLDENTTSVILYLYSYARNLLLQTSNKRYADIMRVCFDMFNGTVDGSLSDTYTLKYLMCEVVGC